MSQFTEPNDRIFYACQAIFTKEKQTVTTGNDESVYTAEYLEGVQSVGVSRSQDRQSLLDVGRFQKMYGFYGKQTFEMLNFGKAVLDEYAHKPILVNNIEDNKLQYSLGRNWSVNKLSTDVVALSKTGSDNILTLRRK